MFDFSKKNKIENNLKLSQELLEYFSLGTGSFSSDALSIIKKAKDKHDILNKAIDLCKDIDEPIAYLNIAKAYKLKGAKYRPECIEFYKKFLINPSFKDEGRMYSIQSFQNIPTEKLELAKILEDLGEAYEGECDFENALKCYLDSYKINPHESPIYCRLAQIYSKMNQLDKAIEFLKSAQKSKYYKAYEWKSPVDNKICKDNTFITVIDSYLKEYEDKKKKGYVYKPRKNVKFGL